jgi:putative flavoprotein involved in K+ transport
VTLRIGSGGPRRTTTVVIGAGHAGLAMSWCLAQRSIDHVVLERGEVANSWRTERWDSLRLLTPNWQSRLPGYGYQGSDPDGFRTMPETIAFIERYADLISAPVRTNTSVTSVRWSGDGYKVTASEGEWQCRTVVLATGACNTPQIPAAAAAVPPAIATLTPMEYRNPGQLDDGGVLVVGASATGTQIADEIHRSGRPVTLAVGEHVRLPRVYRSRDIQWWMDAAGVLDERYDEVDDIVRARNVPSLQLAGSAERRTVDLNALTGIGVKLIGRLVGICEGKAQFSGSLRNQCALADLKMNRLLDTIDRWASENGLDDEVDAPHRFDPTAVDASPPLGIDLASGEIRTIIWATGFRPDYSWLDAPVFDPKGRIRHDGGVVEAPGLYLLGMPFLRRRKSSLIDGAGDDALDLSAHLASYLGSRTPVTRPVLSRSSRMAVAPRAG